MKRMSAWCVMTLCFFIAGCSKEPLNNLSEEESRIYITNYDTTARFNTYRTFSISDSVAVVQDNRLVSKQRNTVDVQFVEAVKNTLVSRGYIQVGRDQNPDLGVAISRMNYTSSNVVSYNDYGGYYGSYWDPYYWDYPGYNYYFPTYYGVYQTNESTLMIDMFDLKNSTQASGIRSVWSGMIRGSGIFDASTAGNQVSALFGQSAYLKAQ